MLGGFVGPFIFGNLHDHLGPPCPPSEEGKCVTAFAYGFLVVGVVCAVSTGVAGVIGLRLRMDGRRSGSGYDIAASWCRRCRARWLSGTSPSAAPMRRVRA
eukprot:1992704-Prymnesium_polylepis.1